MSEDKKQKLEVLNDFGFTLIEMVIVLVIISIIVTLAVPNLNKILGSYQLDISAREMASDIRDLQQSAIKTQNTALSIMWNLDTEAYKLMNDNTVTKNVALPNGIDITLAPHTSYDSIPRMHITANGRPLNGIGGTVVLRDSATGKNKYVIIDTLGRVRVSDTSS